MQNGDDAPVSGPGVIIVPEVGHILECRYAAAILESGKNKRNRCKASIKHIDTAKSELIGEERRSTFIRMKE